MDFGAAQSQYPRSASCEQFPSSSIAWQLSVTMLPKLLLLKSSERDWKPNLNFRGVLDFSIKLQVVEGTATNHTFWKSTLKVRVEQRKLFACITWQQGVRRLKVLQIQLSLLLYVRSNMHRNVLQTLTTVALVSAIFFVAHNFVRYILRGKCTIPLSLYLCKIL